MAGSSYVGRERVLSGIRRTVVDAAAGQGRLVLVSGEPGIGKTSLAYEAAREAVSQEMEVLWATCWDGAGAPAYWPWVQILRAHAAAYGALSADIARILPELDGGGDMTSSPSPSLRRGDSAAERFALFDSVASLLLRAARSRPVMIVIDDLQWADVSSLILLDFLAGQLDTCPMIILGLYRDNEIELVDHGSEVVDQLRHHAELVHLEGLGEDEVAALVAQVSGTEPSADLLSGMIRRTGGNPFFVREVTALLLSRGALDQTGDAGGPIPDGVAPVVRQRLARLPQACVSLLGVAAAAGQETSLNLLVRAAHLPSTAVMEHLEQAVRARVLAPPAQPAGPYRFAHDLFRETLYGDLKPRVRGDLHLHLAQALEPEEGEGVGGHAAELATHFLLAALGHPEQPDLVDKAVRYGRLAAGQASKRLAYEDAAAHLGRTLDGLGPAGLLPERTRVELRIDRADALRRHGALSRAGVDYDAASDWAREHGDGELLGRAALGIQSLGIESGASRDHCIAVLEEAHDALADRETALRAQVLAALARELALGGAAQHARAPELAGLAVEIARRVGEDATLASCLLASHDAIWVPGMAAARRAIATHMGSVARQAGDLAFEAEACLLRALAGLELGDPQALVDLDEFVRIGSAVGQPHFDYLVVTRQAMRAIMTGRFDEAEEHLAVAERLAETLGEPDAWNVSTSQLWIMRTLQGRRAEIEMRLRSGAAPQLKSWIEGQVGLAVLERGEWAAAERLMRAAVAVHPAQLPMSYVIAAQWADLGEAAIALGATADMDRFYAALRPLAGGAVVIAAAVGFGGAIDHHLGMLSAALGRLDEAVEHLEHASLLHERMTAWPWLARSRCALAATLAKRGRAGDHERVSRLVAEVEESAQELGLLGLLRQLDDIAVRPANVFRREGEIWRIAFEGSEIRLRDAKGLADLAILIKAEGREVPATTLAGTVVSVAVPTGSNPVLDRRAQQAYRARLAQLDEDLDQADRDLDRDRSEALAQERDFLVRELSAAVGLGGRERGLGDDRERARKATSARIKEAMQRIEGAHPQLGIHLRESVSTGIFCSYRPTSTVSWDS